MNVRVLCRFLQFGVFLSTPPTSIFSTRKKKCFLADLHLCHMGDPPHIDFFEGKTTTFSTCYSNLALEKKIVVKLFGRKNL